MPVRQTYRDKMPTELHYPWQDTLPATGSRMLLRPGIHWVRMPLPFALNHINLWMLTDQREGQSGWCVVDAGVATEAIRQAWQTIWADDSAAAPLVRMVVTHMHPDHIGNAQWLIEQFSPASHPARLHMSATDHLAAQLSCREATGYGGEHAVQFFASHGLQDLDSLEKIKQRNGYYASMVPSVPRVYARLMDGMSITIGQREWRCLAGYGHSPEHISLFDESDHTLISGDMLLPRISTNISVINSEPEADPLGLFLASLKRLTVLPADTLILPSHGLPFVGLHARVDQLLAHHDARLEDIRLACLAAPHSAAELLSVLFNRPLDLHQTTFAMGEAIAHLNHLWLTGELNRDQGTDGVWRFRTQR